MTSAGHAWRLLAASVVAVSASAQAPAAPAAQAPSICGNQPLCYEAPDFAATITDFRTSQAGHIIDVTVRFTNKTNNLLVLGYTNGSGVATDERGNRYPVWGGNGVRGMGFVNGQSVDPKFQINPGGYGDSRFELALSGYPQVIGFTFELDLSVNEINAYQGNQYTVGSEFPLMWKGLQNGAVGAAPGAVAYAGGAAGGSAGSGTLASIPCQNSTVQNVANGANNAASQVSSAVSSIGSLFGKKPKAASSSASTVPCNPATGATTAATTTTTSTGAVATSPAATTSATTAAKPAATAARPAATPAKPAAPQAATAATPAKTVTPSATQKPAQPATQKPAPPATQPATTPAASTPAKPSSP